MKRERLPLPEIGQVFGHLTVTEHLDAETISLLCICGNTTNVQPGKRRSGMPRKCKKCSRKEFQNQCAIDFNRDPLQPHSRWPLKVLIGG